MSSCCSSSSLSYTASISRPSSSPSTPLFTSATRSHISIPLTNRFSKFGVKCSYADAGVKDTGSSAIDVEADIKSDRLVVLGGSGFVGSAICKAAVSRGIEVISLSRSGRPTSLDSWEDQVTWITGATPKSVLELMDVKDLTLAHVKSHLQMYRTIKTTDKALVSSGQSEVYENGSSADNYDDIMFGIQNQRTELLAEHGGRLIVHQDKEYGLWSNSSSREVLLHGKHGDFEPYIPALEEMNLKGTKNERSSEVSSSSHSETSHKKPNLEFTLGSAH